MHIPQQSSLEWYVKADTSFYGKALQLLLIRLPESGDGSNICPAEQLEQLKERVDVAFHETRAQDCTWLWPLHNKATSLQLQNMSINEKAGESNYLQRLLLLLRLSVPAGGSSFLKIIRDQYGQGMAYCLAWDYLYVQHLWVLTVFVAVVLLLHGSPMEQFGTSSRYVWEGLNWGILIWLAWICGSTWSLNKIVEPPESSSVIEQHMLRNPWYKPEAPNSCHRKLVKMLLLYPAFVLLSILLLGFLLAYVQFNAWLAFDWGDCIQLGCRDPQVKHGFRGWLAEVAADIVMAILFESLNALGSLFGQFAARLSNHELQVDRERTVRTYTLIIEAIGKITPWVFLGIFFVPQWYEQAEADIANADCSDLLSYRLVGKSSFSCLVRRIDVNRRRDVFQMMLKGPFVVAPFISILIKVIVPVAARNLDCLARKAVCCCSCLDAVADGVARILGIIFAYDGDSVGGVIKFIVKGYPFSQPVLSGQKQEVVDDALQQLIRKEFAPRDELLEVRLSLLFVTVFAPIRPVGVFFTLLARLLESQTDLSKMLFVRRRVFPNGGAEAVSMHSMHTRFFTSVLIFKVVWSAWLSVVTYNDDLFKTYEALTH